MKVVPVPEGLPGCVSTKRVSIMAQDCDAYGQFLDSQAGPRFGITVRVRLNPILSNV